ncbi:hypothetical protein ACOMHN_015092 [Nucella lapillus]
MKIERSGRSSMKIIGCVIRFVCSFENDPPKLGVVADCCVSRLTMAVEWSVIFLLAVASSFSGRVCGLEWNNGPDDYVYACAGGRVTLPWQYKVGAGQAVVGVNWLHDGSLLSNMVATLARGHFVATGPYSARVQHVPNGGLVVEDLDAQDSGNYTVEVNVAFGGRFQTFRKTVYLLVGDGLMLTGGLTVEQDPEAWWDPTSQQWFLRLTCGTFPFPPPPLWTWSGR